VSSLNHSNICTLHDVGQQDDVDTWSWSTWSDTLAQRLKKGPLPLDQHYAIPIENCEAPGPRAPPMELCTAI